MNQTAPTRIVILGAGFAGVAVLHGLRQFFGLRELSITLVDRNNFSLYTPMLAEAAGGTVDAPDIVAPIRTLIVADTTFEQAKVKHIDVNAKSVKLSIGGEQYGVSPAERDLPYDHLVIALGSVTSYHDIPGVRDNSTGAKTVEDAIEIRNRALALLERADEEPDPAARKKFLTFVVAGGGFTGVETMASLNDMVRDEVRNLKHVNASEIQTILAQPESRLLPELGTELAAYTQRELETRGVDVRLDTSVTGAGEDWVEIKGKHDSEPTRVETGTLIWAAGVTPSPVIETADLKRGKHHGITVEDTCAVPGQDCVWALGDCAEVPKPDKKSTYAPTAQNAIREGKLVAQNIHAALHGGRQQPFVYKPVGELAIVGKRTGVASIYGLQFKGIVAWALWRGVYLAKLPGFPQRLKVVLDWTLATAFGREVAQLPGGTGAVEKPEGQES